MLEHRKGRAIIMKTTPIEAYLASLLAIATFLIGTPNAAIHALLVLNVLDYISGFTASAMKGKISSKVGFRGIIKKFLFWFLVAGCHWVDLALSQPDTLRNIAVLGLVMNEIVSITENLGKAGVPIPAGVTRMIDSLKGKGDENAKKISDRETQR